MCRICHYTVFPSELYIYRRRSVNFRTEAPGGCPAASTPLAHPSPGPSCSKHAPPQGCSAAAFTLAVCTSYQSDPHPGPSPHACFVLGSALASPGSGLNDVLSEANTDQDSFLVCFPSHQAQITGRPGFLLSGPHFFPSLLKPYDVGGTFICL